MEGYFFSFVGYFYYTNTFHIKSKQTNEQTDSCYQVLQNT